MQRGEVMCPRLRDESVTEQEIKARSPGSTDATQLCNHYTTYHSIANIARLVAVPILCLVFPLAWLQTQQSGVSLCRWGAASSGVCRWLRIRSALMFCIHPGALSAPQCSGRDKGCDYCRVGNGEEREIHRSSIVLPLALPTPSN